MNVIIMGENEKSYMNNIADVFSQPKEDILRSRAAKSARENRNKDHNANMRRRDYRKHKEYACSHHCKGIVL